VARKKKEKKVLDTNPRPNKRQKTTLFTNEKQKGKDIW
jgi:hypothetical protein